MSQREETRGMPRITAHAELMDLMLSRRSVMPKRLVEPGPSQDEIELMAQAALAAPDHGKLLPYRFTLVPQAARERFARHLVDSKRRTSPTTSEAELERAFEKGMNGPTLVVVSAHLQRDHPTIPVREQLIAVGCAIQNFLLAVHALGYGASILSGEKVDDVHLAAALGLPGDLELIGFITIGTESRNPGPRSDPPVSAVLTTWGE